MTNDSASTTVNNSTISGNSAASGGGVSIVTSYGGNITINNSTISGNSAESGGGISGQSSYGGSIVVKNSTISGNFAQESGGGIDASYTELDITNSTITDNTANDKGSGVNLDNGTINSTIIADNANNDDIAGFFGAWNFNSGGNNLIGNGGTSTTFTNDVNGDLVGTLDRPLNPELGELKDNGGQTLTHALLPHSPAINTGSSPEELTTDQRGLDRSIGQTDIGAFEVQANSPDISNYEVIDGNTEDDNLTGTDQKNIISGNDGNDTLNGGPQFDRLNGGQGDDVLSGGGGSNVLKGDAGNDLFYLENTAESIAWIRDFELDRDLLGLSNSVTYEDLEITGRVNSFINYQGSEIAVVLGVSPEELTSEFFTQLPQS